MPKVKLTFSETNPMPESLKAFKVSDTEAEVWVNADQDALAAELNPSLAANRDSIKGEKDSIELKYKALVSTSSADDVKTAKRIADLEAKVTNPIPETDKALLDAIKGVKADATPDFVKQAIQEFPTLSEKLNALETAKANDALFQASGYKDRTVFETVFNSPQFNPNFDSVQWKDEKDAQGNPVKNPYIKVKTPVDGKVELPFADYAKATPEWNPFMPSLTNTQQQQQTWVPGAQHQQQQFQVSPTNGLPTNNFLSAVETGFAKANQPKEQGDNNTK